MRTTIDLPEEVFQRAQEQAAQRGVNVEQFIAAAVVREIGTVPVPKPEPSRPRTRSQLPTMKGKGTWKIPDLTPELEARLQEEEDLASYHRSFGR